MKAVLVIGLGRFGQYLSIKFAQLGNEVAVVDNDETRLKEVLPYVSNGQIADCTDEEVIKSLGVNAYDIVFVCTGSNFQSSLEITALVKDHGAKYVVSKATREIQAKFLLRNGADEVVYPEKQIAQSVAQKYSAEHVFDYIDLGDDYIICEIPVPKMWAGKSLAQVDCRATYRLNVLATKQNDELYPMPAPEHIFTESEHLMVMGENKNVKKILKLMK